MNIGRASCVIDESDGSDHGLSRKTLLEGEVSGMETFYAELDKGCIHPYPPVEKILRIFFFIKGEGHFFQDERSIPVREFTLAIPRVKSEFSVESGKENLCYLEIDMHLTTPDLDDLERQQEKFPFHMDYARCRKYSESIKSEKTISRMILSEGIVPRLCIGSVETTGPDQVTAHTHPMLEQFFLGLKGNDVRVMADTDQTRFLENDLIHIPLGSLHGVHVEAGKDLHYLWIDLFTDQDGPEYIKNSHILINE
ncbi:MAG: cupin domain-containing protein [Bacteroidales bacterium]